MTGLLNWSAGVSLQETESSKYGKTQECLSACLVFPAVSVVLIKDCFSLQILSHVCLVTITYSNADDNYSGLRMGLERQFDKHKLQK